MDALLGGNDANNATTADDYAGDALPLLSPEQPAHVAPVLNVEDETQYLKWLYDLRVVVKRDGISQADIDVVMQIVAQLKAAGAEVLEESSITEEIAALEHFSQRGFTTQRTGLNLVPSLEAIDTGIWATVKAWIAKIIAFLKNLWKEFINRKDESYFEDKYARYIKAIKKVRITTAELEHKYGRLSINGVRDMEALSAKTVLEAPLTASRQQLAGFDKTIAHPLVAASASALSLGQSINQTITRFHKLIKDEATGTGLSGDVVFDRITASGIQASLLKEFAAVSPSNKFLADNLNLPEIMDKFLFNDENAIPFEALRQHLKGMIDGLESVSRARNGGLVEGALEFTEALSTAIGDFQYMCEFFYQTNLMKVVALDTLYRYANARFTVVYREAVKNAVTDKVRETIKYLRDELAKEMAALNSKP